MNKTIYIRDEDVPVWDRAKQVAKDGLSPVIVEGLKRFIADAEAEKRGFEHIEVRFDDADDSGLPKAKAFYGRWIFPPEEPVEVREEYETDEFSIAITAKGNVAVLHRNHHPEGTIERFRVFNSLSHAASEGEYAYAARQAIKKIGVPVEELDI